MANQSPALYRSRSIEPLSSTSPFLSFYRQANRMFEDVFREFDDARESLSGILAPTMDVTQTDREIRITAELPGVKENDIDISVDGDVLTIRAEKRVEQERGKGMHHISERSYGTFQRSLRLPQAMAPEQVKAHFDHGVLTMLLPRLSPSESHHHIAIESGPPPAPASDGGSQPSGSETPH